VRFRLIAAGFALGAVAHGTGLIAFLALHFELRPGYPPWRDAVFTVVDAGLAALALRAPRRLWLPVLAFLVQQVTNHGAWAWRAWTDAHRIDWGLLVTLSFVMWSAPSWP
jgi:hypothetical protein